MGGVFICNVNVSHSLTRTVMMESINFIKLFVFVQLPFKIFYPGEFLKLIPHQCENPLFDAAQSSQTSV